VPLLSSEAPAAAFPQRISELRRGLLRLDRSESARRFDIADEDALLKTTVSLCHVCLAHVPAAVFVRGGRVFIVKLCEVHGRAEAVLENDERFYFLSNKDHSGRRFAEGRLVTIPPYAGGGCCGPEGGGCTAARDAAFGPYTDQLGNKTCTVLVEVTNACNLACRVCYSDAKGDRVLPLPAFKSYLEQLIEQKGGLDSVQLTGGEAMLHPEFQALVEHLFARPEIKKIYLPTNGLLLASAEAAARLAPFRSKLMVLLQFDAARPESNVALRAADPAGAREAVMREMARVGVPLQLTMTLARGVNDDQVGWVVGRGMADTNVKVVALQPATYSGRYDLAPDPMNRLTLSDVLKAVVAQVDRSLRPEDFAPIPCSHPNCGWITLFVRRFGLMRNIVKYIDLPAVMNEVAYKTLLSTAELRSAVGGSKRGGVIGWLGRRLVRSTDIFTVAIKPFMDRFCYDQDRIANCCHHLMDTEGRAVSFCEYNALVRQRDGWERLPRLE
jgi:7,8-dihydro-6-hydroxymethylpterin dimethyltransferase